MAVPRAKTKMTRSNWSKTKRPKTKSHDLATSRQVTVMSRFGNNSLSNYATTYMSRDEAAVPEISDVRIKPHEKVSGKVNDSRFAMRDVSRSSAVEAPVRRLFDAEHRQLNALEMSYKIHAFDEAQRKGHTPIIQVVSFSKQYLQELAVLPKQYDSQKGLVGQELDDAKLRTAIQRSVAKMADQAGFSKLEYVAAIHGNTEHPHVHLAMIETDDEATSRLAARESSDQSESDDNQVGKSPAALAYDKKHKVLSTVERGMMRQSELDYFRQEIDGSLRLQSDLALVRGKEYQKTYAKVITSQAISQALNQDMFVSDFVEVASKLQKELNPDTPVIQALDMRVEQMSRRLLATNAVDTSAYFKAAFVEAELESEGDALAKAIVKHRQDTPDIEAIADYETMDLSPTHYNGVVLTPAEMMSQNPDLALSVFNRYVTDYKQFINDPTVKHLDGLVLRNENEGKDADLLAKKLAVAENKLVQQTKKQVYQMLVDVKASGATPEEIATSLGVALENEESSDLLDIVEPVSVTDKTKKSVDEANKELPPKDEPNELVQANELLKTVKSSQLQDLVNMASWNESHPKSLSKRLQLMGDSLSLRRETLRYGDLRYAGQQLPNAIAAEVLESGNSERLRELEPNVKSDLFADYRKRAMAQKEHVDRIKEAVDNGASFSENQQWQQMRSNVSDSLSDISKNYDAKIGFISEIEDVMSLSDTQQQDRLAKLMLEQAIWRDAIAKGESSKDVKKRLKGLNDLSVTDKLSTALHLKVTELNDTISTQADEISSVTDKILHPEKRDAKTIISDTMRQLDASTIKAVFFDKEHDELDVHYKAVDGSLSVNGLTVKAPYAVTKSLDNEDVDSFKTVVGSITDVIEKPKVEPVSLSKELSDNLIKDIEVMYVDTKVIEVKELEEIATISTHDLELLTNELNSDRQLDEVEKDRLVTKSAAIIRERREVESTHQEVVNARVRQLEDEIKKKGLER